MTDEYKSDLSKFIDSCNDLSSLEIISNGHEIVKQKITCTDLETKFACFNKEGKLKHQVILVYMRMVSLIYQFIRAVRNGDWEGHLNALVAFTKYFLHLTN